MEEDIFQKKEPTTQEENILSMGGGEVWESVTSEH